MSEAKRIEPMNVWAILDPERYIKKSIKDWSLAIYDEKTSADSQIKSISSANNEECFIEELALCNKEKLDEYIEVHNEMYEMLITASEILKQANGCAEAHTAEEIDALLAKARGEQNA